jgi:hypothetical protein
MKKTEVSLITSSGSSQKKEKYNYEEKLGWGTYANVYRATKQGIIFIIDSIQLVFKILTYISFL